MQRSSGGCPPGCCPLLMMPYLLRMDVIHLIRCVMNSRSPRPVSARVWLLSYRAGTATFCSIVELLIYELIFTCPISATSWLPAAIFFNIRINMGEAGVAPIKKVAYHFASKIQASSAAFFFFLRGQSANRLDESPFFTSVWSVLQLHS